jgi:hypothetical protein
MNFSPRKQRGQGIVKVSDLFKKYTEILKAPQGIVTTAFIEVVKDVVGVTLQKHQCVYSVNSRTITVHTSGMVKSEIMFKKELILTQMIERLGEKSAPKTIL